MYQEIICYYSNARQAQGYTGIDSINNRSVLCVSSVIACRATAGCHDTTVPFHDADDRFADDRYTAHLQPMIAFHNARSTARRLVANGRRLQRSNRQTPSISVGRNSADPILAWLNRLHRARDPDPRYSVAATTGQSKMSPLIIVARFDYCPA